MNKATVQFSKYFFENLVLGLSSSGKNFQIGLANLVLFSSVFSKFFDSIFKNLVSESWKISNVLSTSMRNVFKQIFLLSLFLSKESNLMFLSIIKFMRESPKTLLPNIIKLTVFLYDIFNAGLSSPIGMIKQLFLNIIKTLNINENMKVNMKQLSLFFSFVKDIFTKSYKYILRSYFTAVFNCGKIFFTEENGVLGFTKLSKNCRNLLSSFFVLFGLYKEQIFDLIFVDNSNNDDDGGGGGGNRGNSVGNKKFNGMKNSQKNALLSLDQNSISRTQRMKFGSDGKINKKPPGRNKIKAQNNPVDVKNVRFIVLTSEF